MTRSTPRRRATVAAAAVGGAALALSACGGSAGSRGTTFVSTIPSMGHVDRGALWASWTPSQRATYRTAYHGCSTARVAPDGTVESTVPLRYLDRLYDVRERPTPGGLGCMDGFARTPLPQSGIGG